MQSKSRRHIWVFTLALFVAAGLMTQTSWSDDYRPTWQVPIAPWAVTVVVSLLFVFFSSIRIGFKIGKSDVVACMNETAVIVGFLFLSGSRLIVAMFIGALLAHRHLPVLKLWFNVASECAAIAPFVLLSSHLSMPVRLRLEIPLLVVGLVLRWLVSTLALRRIFRLLGLINPDFGRAERWSIVPAVAVASASAIGLTLLRAAPWALLGWAAWLGVTWVLYLFAARSTERLAKVTELLEFNDGLAVAKDLSGMGTAARHMIHAQYAEIIVVESPTTVMRSAADPTTGESVSMMASVNDLPDAWRHVLLTADAAHITEPGSIAWLVHPLRDQHEVLVVPFASASGQTLGLLVCVDPQNEANTFSDEEFTLLKRLALHAAIWMQSEHNALHDPLTGLANRRLLTNHVDSAIGLGVTGSLLMMDLNSFKAINDTHGHGAGDDVLVAQGERLRSIVGTEGVVARLGGDEFAVWSTTSDPEALAHEIAKQLAAPIAIGSQSVTATASIGVAQAPLHATSCSELLWHADSAMFAAKRGTTSLKMVSEEDLQNAARLRRLRQDIADAVDSGQIEVAYQPIVELNSCRIVGFEALARWEHPTFGTVSPEDFIPIVKDSGRLHRLTLQTIEKALVARHEWEAISGEPLTVNVNLDPSSLAEEALIEEVGERLQHSKTGPDRLNLEIVEAALGAIDRTYLLHRIRDLGVGVVIDDFGTGHSTLHRIARLPVSGIKLDRTFADMTKSLNPEIVSLTVNIARGKAARLTVEGIETLEDAQHMVFLGATHAQGFYFGKAMPRVLAAEAVRRQRDTAPEPLSSGNVAFLRPIGRG